MKVKKRIKPISPEFEDFVNGMRQNLLNDMGVEMNFTQTTKTITRILKGLELNFNLLAIPKNSDDIIQIKTKRRKRKRKK